MMNKKATNQVKNNIVDIRKIIQPAEPLAVSA